MPYVDGFVLAVPKARLADYRKMARKTGKLWMEHGALSFVECVADDVPAGRLTSFTRAVKLKRGEIVVFAWISYKSRRHRDAVNKKVMADRRLETDMSKAPFDGERMIHGGFKSIIEL